MARVVMVAHNDDSKTLERITGELGTNFIVEAGAGTGKTYALVSRVVALVKAGDPMGGIVAITFTEAAATELSERIRSRMEQLLDDDHSDNKNDKLYPLNDAEKKNVAQALGEIDQASIQTIHSFAAQLLQERPLDAGLPPGWSPMDEIEGAERFADKWDKWRERALGVDASADLQDALRGLLRQKVGMGKWREVAEAFSGDDRLRDAGVLGKADLAALANSTISELRSLAALCADPSDRLYEQLELAIKTVEDVLEAADSISGAAAALAEGESYGNKVDYSGAVGTRNNWSIAPKMVRDRFREVGRAFQKSVKTAGLPELLLDLQREFAVEYEADRKADGVAGFQDLLVWARDLLRDRADARGYFQERYSRILIDEFQDTDPLQAEIAFYLAATASAPIGKADWHELPLVAGKLFIVGDPKQSIYRFRRADIGVTQRVVDSGRLERLIIVQNRRSQSAVVDWVNAVFGELMVQEGAQSVRVVAQSVRGGVQASFGELMFQDEAHDEKEQPAQVQAKYIPLEAHGDHQVGVGAVRVFGGASGDRADDVRRRQARDVAAIIGGVGDLRVYDKDKKCARAARLRDVCVLVRSRTGLGILERGLEAAGIPYRLEGGSLLFDTQEVRDMLNCLRAIDDPTDEVSVVAALRSPAFACSDVDLMRWREEGGGWDYLARGLDDAARAGSPVGDGLRALRGYHRDRLGKGTAQLIAEFTRDRRLDELDLAEARPREAWRRRRFLLEEARARDAAGANTLNQFIRWAARQQEEGAQISQPDMPDGDEDAARIMTMHGSKGLEFPIVILLGLDAVGGGSRGGAAVQFDQVRNSVEVAFSKDFRTPGYDALDEGEKRHSEAEAVRLAYVAATRARDHLYVSLHHRASVKEGVAEPNDNVIAGMIEGMADRLPHSEADLSDASVLPMGVAADDAKAPLPYDLDAWRERRAAAIGRSAAALAVTATRVARNAGERPDDWGDIEDKEGEPDDERPWLAGRGGTAMGSAVHATLQSALEVMTPDLPLADGADLGGLIDAYDAEIGRLADRQAAQHGVADKGEVRRLAGDALAHDAVGRALRARRRWSEISVAAPLEVDGREVALEGIIDLLYETEDGELVILDYKTDDVRSARDLERKRARYRYQGACYAYAVGKATGKRVRAVQFLFIRRARAGDGLQEVEFRALLGELAGLAGGG